MTDRRSARRAAKRAAPAIRPRFGPWTDRPMSGWSVCAVHGYGVAPGTTCLPCRLEADMKADPDAYEAP